MTPVRQDERNDRNSEPSAAVSRIAAAVRAERARTGMSLSELARRAGVAKSTLSQVEAGQGNPGVETIWALATALGVPFSALIDPPEAQSRLIRAGEGEATRAQHAEYAAVVLSHCPPQVRRDLFRIDAEPGPPRRSAAHAPGTVEHVVLIAGRALTGAADEPVELGPGDYHSYPGDVPHVFDALEPGTSAVLVSQQR
ncbi:transcriptional regulator with XRE-family HTH domain [Naumannella cuiyingiana]|uniref:Transcriptional regulator with XRE-family HTH domain n=1 Tax=Naumannella cuiyingiana TaxID=1347891 RepID=A0A7Z0IM61_9ACTN|nr:XRE family transcriptional regulator [Naumannella cuiyingiana]NYI72247.1 transcriptional regulator with XRE-family HTH domain [Naumannella cuiyingiana]